MRDRIKIIYGDYKKAYNNLKYAVDNANDELDIDGTIKRFELSYELSWKLIKEILADLGIICKNPRNCFKEAVNNNLIIDEEKWIDMIEMRNRLVHTYSGSQSREFFDDIKTKFVELFQKLLENSEKMLSI